MAYYLLRRVLMATANSRLVFLFAALASVGVSALNEIMEFLISINMQNGVGGYENTMLDLCFNLGGAIIAVGLYLKLSKKV